MIDKLVDKQQGMDKKQIPRVGWVDRCQKQSCGFHSSDGRCLYRKGVMLDVNGCCMSDKLFGSHPPTGRSLEERRRGYIHWYDNPNDERNKDKEVSTK